ncbi:MAG TPA: hypothetical protein VGI81_04565 [Tepidisphaeraceae bacterium]|jgi:hypothetical protein
MTSSRCFLLWLLPLTAVLAGVGVVGGCAPKTQTTIAPPPPRPNPPPQVAADPTVRVQTLDRLADEYARTSNDLPGDNAAEHRKLMSQVFAQLEEILPILEGPNPGAEFRQQLQVVRDAQAELSTGPQDLSPEPTIDTGLRAARDVLSSTAQHGFYDQSSLTPMFDQLTAKINQLDTVRGPLHQVVAGEAVGLSSQIISKMADTMTHRLAQEQQGQPPANPTTEPATSPSSTAANGK